jgi:hypothetical protein
VVPISYPSGIAVQKLNFTRAGAFPKIIVLGHIGSLIDTYFSVYIKYMNDNRFSWRSDHQDKPNTINKIGEKYGKKFQMFINYARGL